MAHALGMPYRVGDSRRPSGRYAQEGNPLQARCVDYRLDVTDSILDAEPAHAAVGEAHAAGVVADEEVVFGPEVDGCAPKGVLPLVLEVREPTQGADERRVALAARGVGNADAVGCFLHERCC